MSSDDLKLLIEAAMISLLIGVGAYLQHRHRFLQYTFFLRVPLLLALLLLLLPLAVYSRAFGNLFVMTSTQLGVVAFLVVFATLAIIYSGGLIFVGAAPRFRLRFQQPDGKQATGWDNEPLLANQLNSLFDLERRRGYVVPLLLGLPILATSFVKSKDEGPWRNALAIVIGLGLAIGACELAMWVGRRFRRWLSAPQRSVPTSQVFKIRQRIRQFGYRFSDTAIGRVIAQPFASGYSNLSSQAPATTGTPAQESKGTYSHWKALCFTVLGLIVYVTGAFVLSPDRGDLDIVVASTPALAYVLLVVMLFGLILPSATFLLDFYRVPLVALLLGALVISYKHSDLDHYYRFASGDRPVGQPLTAEEVFKAWQDFRKPDRHPVMAVIAISGGGSHAARWTTEVLRRLRADTAVGARFFESTTLMSVVSGGGLGAMYVLANDRNDDWDPLRLEESVNDASATSAGALAWGLTYPDLIRKVLPWLPDPLKDRGWALERSWGSRLDDPSRVPTLDSWSTDVRNGTRPAIIFNATSAETGKRLLVSRVLVPGTEAHQFATLYPNRDLSVVTAARLSAAFPYLSPMARPYLLNDDRSADFEKQAFHLGDGGYYDSTGTLTAVEFLRSILPGYRATGRTKIAFVQIRAALDDAASTKEFGWLPGLAGPPATSLKVSLSSQAARAALEVELLAQRWNNEDLPEDRRVQIKPIVFRLRDTGTLPWHLSETEKASISDAWEANENRQALTDLVAFLAGSP